MADDALDLSRFVEAAGAGLTQAQGSIAGAELASTRMAVSEATLVARVALDADPTGGVRVQTLDRDTIRSLGAAAGSLSTVTVNFVALADTATPPAAGPAPIGRDKAIEAVASRADVLKLAEVLGPLRFDATLVPERATWLVTAQDPTGRTVREVVVGEEA